MKILIAEDDAMWRTLLARNTQNWDFDPVIAESGDAALKALLADEETRLAILDWEMPGISGVDVCRRIKSNSERPFTYILLVTSRKSNDDIVTGLDAGADDYLTKPVDMAILKSRLAAARRIVEAIPPKEWSRPRIEGYEVHRILGKGAFATVWLATRKSTGEDAALKILRVDLATEQVFDRFSREIEVMKGLDHPCLAKIYDSRIDRSIGYYAMDLINGGTMHDYLKREKPNAVEIIQIIIKICRGLDHAHQKGIIHRDLKPTNVMLTVGGEPKIVDFGLGKDLFQPLTEDLGATVDGSVLGTPLFMSPEQARGEIYYMDGRSDLYSVAVMLYLILLRRHPHQIHPQDRDVTLKTIGGDEVRRPSSIKKDFNPKLEQILLKALAQEPVDRYATAGSFADALEHFLDERERRKSGVPSAS